MGQNHGSGVGRGRKRNGQRITFRIHGIPWCSRKSKVPCKGTGTCSKMRVRPNKPSFDRNALRRGNVTRNKNRLCTEKDEKYSNVVAFVRNRP